MRRSSPSGRSYENGYSRRDFKREPERHDTSSVKTEKDKDHGGHRERETRDYHRSNVGETNRQHQPVRVGTEPSTVQAGDVGSTRDYKPDAASEKRPRTPPSKRKFTNRCRLFVGSLPMNMTENGMKELFEKYGEVSEIYVHASKNFGFVRMDTRANAEKAKEELDGSMHSGREMRVRFAAPNCTVLVDNLHPMVSNELLEDAFTLFGTVERAVVLCDERGKSLCRGFVDFARRTSAVSCVKACNEKLFILTRSPQPVIVRAMENNEDEGGIQDRALEKHPNYQTERVGVEPHFAVPGSFEFEAASQWKALADSEKAQRDLLEKQIRDARLQVQVEVEQAVLDHQAEQMRRDLQRRQEELQRFEDQRRQEKAKFLDHQRRMDSQRRDEYYQQQEALFQRHAGSGKAVETFLRSRHQQLDDMYLERTSSDSHGHRQQGPAGDYHDSRMDDGRRDHGLPMASAERGIMGARPEDMAPRPIDPDRVEHRHVDVSAGIHGGEQGFYDNPEGGSHHSSGGVPPWNNIAAAVNQIRDMLGDEPR